MSRVVHHHIIAVGPVFATEVPSGTEILAAKWRQRPDQPDPTWGDVALYIEKPVEPNGAYRGERRLEAFIVATGEAFDQADFKFVTTVRQPGRDASAFWHVYARLTEADA